ncbi:MAG: hydrogenase maturation protein [Burkholderiaceae bacterium]
MTTTSLRVLLLAHSFNSLTQRLWCLLRAAGHQVSLELDIADSVTEEAVAMFRPDLLIAPFLKRRIPESVWSRLPCWVLHPGVEGDRGPAALDRAILRGEPAWGVTLLQADGDWDAGPVWASEGFAMRDGTKSSLYRHEVTAAAVRAVEQALRTFRPGAAQPPPRPAGPPPAGQWWPPLPAAERRVDWARDDTATVLRKLAASDGHPGAPDELAGQPCRLFDAHDGRVALRESGAAAAPPGTLLARRGPALLRATVDGAVWLGAVRLAVPVADGEPGALKLPATQVFAAEAAALPEWPVALDRPDPRDWDELHYAELGDAGRRVGVLRFDFHNGAMSERQCRRLTDALRHAKARPTQVLVLAGGAEFFSNGIHLHVIESAARVDGDSAADASWRNIVAMDDAVLELLTCTDKLTVAALRGNAGAGGVFLALAADEVWGHGGVVLNPHYKNMGNLYGSEYWTYVLPRRVGAEQARTIPQGRLPVDAAQALSLGLVDAVLTPSAEGFLDAAVSRAAVLAADGAALAQRVAAKAARRQADEAAKPLAAYRDEELARMRRDFYGFDPSYHVARHHFVHRRPHAWTPRHLALHR